MNPPSFFSFFFFFLNKTAKMMRGKAERKNSRSWSESKESKGNVPRLTNNWTEVKEPAGKVNDTGGHTRHI